jgi:hypothetical protein
MSVRFDVELTQLATVTRVLAVLGHVVGELDEVTGRSRLASATHTTRPQISLLSARLSFCRTKVAPGAHPYLSLSGHTLDGLMTDRPSVWAPEDFTDCCFMTGKLNAEAVCLVCALCCRAVCARSGKVESFYCTRLWV